MLKEVTPYQKDILKNRARISLNEIVLPRYYAVFLNQKSPILSNSKIAMALDMAIDKEALVREVFFNDAEVINAPISKNFLGFSDELNQITFDPQKSIELLSEAGYEYDDAEGLFSKTSGDKKTNLEFTLLLPSINELIHLSDIIKKN
jgi:ABC-type transport system substrate-binding protein